jgi:hypothetical protein
MTADTVVNSSFKGTSLEFSAVGLAHLMLTETGEHITFKRPDNSANNLVFGTLFVDVHGVDEPREDVCIQHLFPRHVLGTGNDVNAFFHMLV